MIPFDEFRKAFRRTWMMASPGGYQPSEELVGYYYETFKHENPRYINEALNTIAASGSRVSGKLLRETIDQHKHLEDMIVSQASLVDSKCLGCAGTGLGTAMNGDYEYAFRCTKCFSADNLGVSKFIPTFKKGKYEGFKPKSYGDVVKIDLSTMPIEFVQFYERAIEAIRRKPIK